MPQHIGLALPLPHQQLPQGPRAERDPVPSRVDGDAIYLVLRHVQRVQLYDFQHADGVQCEVPSLESYHEHSSLHAHTGEVEVALVLQLVLFPESQLLGVGVAGRPLAGASAVVCLLGRQELVVGFFPLPHEDSGVAADGEEVRGGREGAQHWLAVARERDGHVAFFLAQVAQADGLVAGAGDCVGAEEGNVGDAVAVPRGEAEVRQEGPQETLVVEGTLEDL